MTILSGDLDMRAVRAAIDTSLDETVLPDSTIQLDLYLFAGEAEVYRRDPLADSRTGTARQHIVNAAVCYVAALLAVALPNIQSESTADGARYQRETVKWNELAAALRARGEQELGYVLDGGSVTSLRWNMFAKASGTRGR